MPNPSGLLDGNTPLPRDDTGPRDNFAPGEHRTEPPLNASGDLCGIGFSTPGAGCWSSRGKSTAPVYKPSPFTGRFRVTRLAGGVKEG